MNIKNKYTNLGKSILSGVLCAGVLTASMGSQANTQQEVSQVPLNLSEGVPPNIIVTIDDSTSMDRAYVPDGLGATGNRRFRANSFNAMYYNPAVTYKLPPSFKKDGSEKILSTSFSNAYLNGFRPDSDESSNLNANYYVATDVIIRSSGTTRDRPSIYNPEYDFRCGIKRSLFDKNGDSSSCDGSGWHKDKLDSWSTRTGKITITRTDDSSCTAVMEAPGVSIDAPCAGKTIDGNDYFVADLTKSAVPAYYYIPDDDFGAVSPDKSHGYNDCVGYEQCYRLVFVTENSGVIREDDKDAGRDERQNFANWYSFYRARSLATISAASLAFYNLSPSSRMTWQSLHYCTGLNGGDSSKCDDNKFREFGAKHRGEFYHWIQQTLPMYSNTPLRAAMDRAGKFLNGSSSVAWHKYPNDSSKTNNADNTYACRASYHVLMTDGVWNSNDASGIGKTYNDDAAISLPSGTGYTGTRPSQYTPAAPFQGGGNNSLADVAMNYWAMDLNSSLDNKVKPYMPFKSGNDIDDYWDPRNNPADWQHMVNFVMGLGLTNSLNDTNIPWEGGTYLGEGYKNLKSGTAVWPTVGTSSANVYDLWHAAINSRGEFFSVDSPDAMVAAFDSILNRIANRKSSAAKPGTSTTVESDGDPLDPADRLASYFYQTTFNSSSGWSGDVQKVKKYRKWNPVDEKFEDVVEEGWSAKAAMPAYTARNIKIANGAASLQDFVVGNAGLPSTLGTLAYWLNFNPDPSAQVATWSDRLAYIRGNRSKEGENDGDLRVRTSILGDFLSSQPAVVTGARYLEGFANRLESPETGTPTTTYSTFMASIANRRGQLYVGGNDGMLHAFDTATGEEKFAFIPTAVFPKLNKLTGKNYTHEYYVDGTPVIADVYDGTNWRTILVGTLRAGGKGLFALDITNPDDIQLLWEFGENSIADEDAVKPGYSFPQPTVARMHNGQWAVVTGNGYKGAGTSNGAAALYVIDAITGEMISNLKVQSPNADGGENGLSSPRLADYDSDGVADYAYAGDLHGNLWRFDLLGAGASAPTVTPPSNGSYGAKNSETTFSVSYGGEPMFTATSTVGGKPQPITSAPSLVRHPTRKGYLVMFGTGKYFEIGDKTGEESFAQTVYGIWDMKTKAEATSAETVSRSKLQQQTITSATTGTGKTTGAVRDARIISNNAVEWYTDFDSSKPVNKRGWYLDLTLGGFDGEMMIENMRSLGSMLLLQTLVPNDDPCANGSTNWLYAINPATGGRTLHHAFDTQAADNTIVSAIKFGSEGGVSISSNEKGLTANGDGSGGGSGVPEPIYLDPSSLGRQSWRMVPDA